jgi:hypothetical protein
VQDHCRELAISVISNRSDKPKRPETFLQKPIRELRLLSREKRGNFCERTALEARSNRGVPKAFLSGIHVPSLGRE